MKTAPAVRIVALGLGLVACGGGEVPPTAPTTTAPAETAKSTATAEPAPPPPAAAKNKVDFLETKNSAAPDKMPTLKLDVPGHNQKIPGHYAQEYRLRYTVGNWAGLPEGSYIQFILDNVPYRPVTDPKEKVRLKDLAGGTVAEGEHVLAIYIARKNHESYKTGKALVVRRFWIGKKGDSAWNASNDPFMVMGRPHGTYEGEASQEIIGDFFVTNAELGDKKYSIKMSLHGPGIKDDQFLRYITEWKPVLVLFPAAGDYLLKATLTDAQGAPVKAPWNPTERKFTVRSGKTP